MTGAEVLARIAALRDLAFSRYQCETGSVSLIQEWLVNCTDHMLHAWRYTPTETPSAPLAPSKETP
ncbi:hypothetical protein ABT246_24650 [Streptomyces sp. NPDC001553]|uniref:hypothetical protein n=1 Tax=Streptomyces sp. NPDC001553 TaxID=3154385 RepID=UPI00332142EC